MLNEQLDKNEIYNIAISFRTAIIKAKQNEEFTNKDRMFNFPSGCCDDSCDLLAYYLHDKYQIHVKQVMVYIVIMIFITQQIIHG